MPNDDKKTAAAAAPKCPGWYHPYSFENQHTPDCDLDLKAYRWMSNGGANGKETTHAELEKRRFALHAAAGLVTFQE